MKSEQLAASLVTDPLPEAARAMTAAAAQITLALQESQQPVEQLGASVGRIIMTLSSIRAAAEAVNDPAMDKQSLLQIKGGIAELARHAAQATVTLQFYDRMTQHLTHLHDYLDGIGELLATASAGGGERDRWEELRERLCVRLISDSQRQCLNGQPARAQRDAPDSIELF
jgi:hypothetical protein